jgi:hypothetical protein
MTRSDEFKKAVWLDLYKGQVDSVVAILKQPPGRSPRREWLDLSNWYLSLDLDGRAAIEGIVRLAVESSVFGFAVALDNGRRLIDDDLVLLAAESGDNLDPDEDLHEWFRSEVDSEMGIDTSREDGRR